jgi:hypothetical protein
MANRPSPLAVCSAAARTATSPGDCGPYTHTRACHIHTRMCHTHTCINAAAHLQASVRLHKRMHRLWPQRLPAEGHGTWEKGRTEGESGRTRSRPHTCVWGGACVRVCVKGCAAGVLAPPPCRSRARTLSRGSSGGDSSSVPLHTYTHAHACIHTWVHTQARDEGGRTAGQAPARWPALDAPSRWHGSYGLVPHTHHVKPQIHTHTHTRTHTNTHTYTRHVARTHTYTHTRHVARTPDAGLQVVPQQALQLLAGAQVIVRRGREAARKVRRHGHTHTRIHTHLLGWMRRSRGRVCGCAGQGCCSGLRSPGAPKDRPVLTGHGVIGWLCSALQALLVWQLR